MSSVGGAYLNKKMISGKSGGSSVLRTGEDKSKYNERGWELELKRKNLRIYACHSAGITVDIPLGGKVIIRGDKRRYN